MSVLFDNIDILYIEDNQNISSEVKNFFKLFNSVDVCINAKEALVFYASKFYDIVITDIDLKGKSGLVLSKEIRSIHEEQPIVIVTQNSDRDSFLESIEIGVDAYILKPFIQKRVVKSIKKIVQNISYKKEIKKYNDNLEFLLEEKSKELVYSLSHDYLTGIYNNFAFLQKIKEKKSMDVLLLNIDYFSNINDTYGFDIGDDVLVEISRYLKIVTPSNFTLYRLESDEFIMICENPIDTQVLIEYAESIISFFNQSEISIAGDMDVKISFSIGIATGSGMSVLNSARVAIKELREHRNGYYKLYDPNSKYLHKQNDNIYWIHKIRDAVNHDKLVPYFQPIINNNSGKIEKYECLARIEENGKVISPIHFMKAAEMTGALHFITRSIIEQSFKNFSNTEFEFAINITNDDLYLDYLKDFLMRNSKKYGIKPSRVVLEILEDITSLKGSNILAQLASLREVGFKIAIDDFGSQSSNFSRLIEFNPDYLKIDGAFIKNIVTDPKSQAITEAIVLICKKSGIKVIAEYIHNRDVQERIEALGIDYSQGYYFSEPKKEI